MTYNSSVTSKSLWSVLHNIYAAPQLLRAEQVLHLCTWLRVWVSKGAELDPGNPRQHSEGKWVFCICPKARKRLPLPGCHTQVCHRLQLQQSRDRASGHAPGKTRDKVLYLGVPCTLGSQPHGTAPGCGCSLFIGKGKKCNDAQQGDVCWRIYYISGRGGEEEKGRKRERRKRFLAFQKCSQRHLAVISAEVHQTSDRVCLTKKSKRVNGVTVSWACADRNSHRARPRTETRGQRLGSIQGPD